MGLNAALLLIGVAAILWRVEAFARRYLGERHDERTRELQLRERELALQEKRMAEPLDVEAIPTDLLMRVNAESQQWAREQMRSLVQQLYLRHQNWDAVRMEVQNMDAVSVMSELGWSQTTVLS